MVAPKFRAANKEIIQMKCDLSRVLRERNAIASVVAYEHVVDRAIAKVVRQSKYIVPQVYFCWMWEERVVRKSFRDFIAK